MLRSILRAIVVLFAGGWGIGACMLALLAFVDIRHHRPGDPWAEEAAFGVGAFFVGIALIWFAWWVLYPSPPRPPADDAEVSRQPASANPGALICILALMTLIVVAIKIWIL